jgi:hypothetical protein
MAKQSKSGTRKKRPKRRRPGESSATDAPIAGGGVMQGMVGGFRRAVGVGDGRQKKRSALGTVIWLLLLAGAVGVLAYRLSG